MCQIALARATSWFGLIQGPRRLPAPATGRSRVPGRNRSSSINFSTSSTAYLLSVLLAIEHAGSRYRRKSLAARPRTTACARAREGLGKDIIRKSRSSRLIAIIDNLPAVEAWRADDLDDKQRFDWASREAVHRHCPLFAKDKPEPKPALERAFERLIKESEKATSDEKAHATPLWESLASVWAPAKNKTKKAA